MSKSGQKWVLAGLRGIWGGFRGTLGYFWGTLGYFWILRGRWAGFGWVLDHFGVQKGGPRGGVYLMIYPIPGGVLLPRRRPSEYTETPVTP